MKIEFKNSYQLLIITLFTFLLMMLYEIGENRLHVLKAGIEQGIFTRDFDFWFTAISVITFGFIIKFAGTIFVLVGIAGFVLGKFNIVEPHFYIKESQKVIFHDANKDNKDE